MLYLLKQVISFDTKKRIVGVYSSSALAIDEAVRLLKMGSLDTEYLLIPLELDASVELDSRHDEIDPIAIENNELLVIKRSVREDPAVPLEDEEYVPMVHELLKAIEKYGAILDTLSWVGTLRVASLKFN
jgi:hypothetical protein